MSRSIKKGPYVDAKLAKKVEAAKASNSKTPIKTWARAYDNARYDWFNHSGS